MTASSASPAAEGRIAQDMGFDPARLRRIGQAAQDDIDAKRNGGFLCEVTRRGQMVYTDIRGHADREAQRPLRSDALLFTASVGKQFLNVIVLSYVERGLLRLHQPVAEILPRFGSRGKGRVNLQHLLTHTSGIMSGLPPLPAEELIVNARVAEYVMDSVLELQPGSKVNYTLIAAQAIMAEMLLAVDGRRRSLSQLMEDELFRPLKMTDTSLSIVPERADRCVEFYAAFDKPGMFTPAAISAMNAMSSLPGCEIPGAAYRTSIKDLSRFAQMLNAAGELEGERILSPAMIAFASRNFTLNYTNQLYDYTYAERGWDSAAAFLGLGFFLRGEGITPGPFGVLNSPSTFGGIGAGSATFWVDPHYEVTFSMLTVGVMDEADHLERSSKLSDIVISSIIS